MSESPRRPGFIGMGVMGEPMCARLATRSGCPVLAFDRDAAALARAAGFGAQVAASPREVIAGSDVVFLSLPSGEVVSEVSHGPEGLLEHCRAKQIIVDLSTSSVKITRALSAEFAKRGVAFADAPVARTRAAAEAGSLLVMVGGSAEAFATVRPLIANFATDIVHCGESGSGQVMKILNNMVLFEIGVALSEARAIALRSGVEPRLLFETLAKGSADSFALRNHGLKAIVPGEFPSRAFSVEYARKDLRYALQLAGDVKVNAQAARHVDALFARAIEAGLGELYWPVISEVVSGT